YGEILGYDFAQRLHELSGNDLLLIEAGAHDGQLAADLLAYLREYQRDTFRRIQYVIIEPSFTRAEKQFKTLAQYNNGKVRWVKSWDEIPEFRGVCFSNELLDAMPVHVFRWDASEKTWTEWGITNHQSAFHWKRLPEEKQSARARKLLARLHSEFLAVLPNDFT